MQAEDIVKGTFLVTNNEFNVTGQRINGRVCNIIKKLEFPGILLRKW